VRSFETALETARGISHIDEDAIAIRFVALREIAQRFNRFSRIMMTDPASDPAAEISWQSNVLRSPSADGSWLRDIVVITLLAGAIFLLCFSRRDLANPDEGRYAEIPREMVASGDWVTPRLDGVKYFEKPPLIYWMEAVCIVVLGPAEWSLRVPAALFYIGGLLLTYVVARRLFGRTAAITAAAVLATSGLYFLLSGLLILDVAVSVLISATLVCFILGVRAPPGATRRWLFYALYASAALATLT
jgi:4-amino-4-deoxy-L-arabinose transferase-like glycosyltransferase